MSIFGKKLIGYKDLRGFCPAPESALEDGRKGAVAEYAEVDEIYSCLWGLVLCTKTVTVWRHIKTQSWHGGSVGINKETFGYDCERMYAQYLAGNSAIRELLADAPAPTEGSSK